MKNEKIHEFLTKFQFSFQSQGSSEGSSLQLKVRIMFSNNLWNKRTNSCFSKMAESFCRMANVETIMRTGCFKVFPKKGQSLETWERIDQQNLIYFLSKNCLIRLYQYIFQVQISHLLLLRNKFIFKNKFLLIFSREKSMNAKLIIKMSGNTTYITNPEDS